MLVSFVVALWFPADQMKLLLKYNYKPYLVVRAKMRWLIGAAAIVQPFLK